MRCIYTERIDSCMFFISREKLFFWIEKASRVMLRSSSMGSNLAWVVVNLPLRRYIRVDQELLCMGVGDWK